MLYKKMSLLHMCLVAGISMLKSVQYAKESPLSKLFLTHDLKFVLVSSYSVHAIELLTLGLLRSFKSF